MKPLALLILLITSALPICWLVAEFKASRQARITLGILAMIVLTAVSALVSIIVTQLDYNSYYGTSTKRLLEATIVQLEIGRTQKVLNALKTLRDGYYPTYENRAGYVPLVKKTVDQLNEYTETNP